MYRTILREQDGPVARITLNRPEKRNAISTEMVGELKQELAAAHRDDVHSVVITGAGRDFCSGADLSDLEQISRADVLENLADAEQLAELFLMMRRHPKPIVAAVRGRALAGGCGLATACDVVLASESAQFGYPEVNIGFVPAMVMAMLRRCVSEKNAFHLAVSGEVISASSARDLGLVQRLIPDDSFEQEVGKYAAGLAAKPASAVALAKGLLYRMDALNFEAAVAAGVQTNTLARMTDECRAGVRRFLQK